MGGGGGDEERLLDRREVYGGLNERYRTLGKRATVLWAQTWEEEEEGGGPSRGREENNSKEETKSEGVLNEG